MDHSSAQKGPGFACPYQVFNPAHRCITRARNYGGYAHLRLLKRHLRRRHSKSNRCTRCWNAVYSPEALDAHDKTCHSWQAIHPCDDLFMTPEQEEELARQYPRNMGQSDVWYFLFRLLVPGMRNLSIAEIRAQYPSPYARVPAANAPLIASLPLSPVSSTISPATEAQITEDKLHQLEEHSLAFVDELTGKRPDYDPRAFQRERELYPLVQNTAFIDVKKFPVPQRHVLRRVNIVIALDIIERIYSGRRDDTSLISMLDDNLFDLLTLPGSSMDIKYSFSLRMLRALKMMPEPHTLVDITSVFTSVFCEEGESTSLNGSGETLLQRGPYRKLSHKRTNKVRDFCSTRFGEIWKMIREQGLDQVKEDYTADKIFETLGCWLRDILNASFPCMKGCPQRFMDAQARRQHHSRVHRESSYYCEWEGCIWTFKMERYLISHYESVHSQT